MTGLEPPDTRSHPTIRVTQPRVAPLLAAIGVLAAVALIVAVLA